MPQLRENSFLANAGRRQKPRLLSLHVHEGSKHEHRQPPNEDFIVVTIDRMFGNTSAADPENCSHLRLDLGQSGSQSIQRKIKEVSRMAVALAHEMPAKQAGPSGGDRSNRSLVALVDFTSIEAYEVYEKHPEHLACIEQKIKPLLLPGSRAAIQYVS
eukprot:s2191_g4.t1